MSSCIVSNMHGKRASTSGDTESSRSSAPPTKKRALSVSTVDKWILDYDKTLNTATSLASQPYFSPCAHARKIKWAGKGKKNTSGDSYQAAM